MQQIQNQSLKQTQRLIPKLIQRFKLFQQPYTDLVTEIQKQSEDNVVIEIVRDDNLIHQFQSTKPKMATDFQTPHPDNTLDFLKAKSQSLYDHLIHQLNLASIKPKDEAIAKILIEHIDSRGYLTEYPKAVRLIKSTLEVADRKIHDILKIIQTFDPDGVGARDLKECLLIQINEYNFEHEDLRDLLREMITHHLTDLAEKKYAKIANKLNIPENAVDQLSLFIKDNLNPNPGIRWSSNEQAIPIIPSFKIQIEDNKITITNLEKENGIEIKISEKYRKMLQDSSIDEKTRQFIKEKLQKATELIENIKKRTETLEKVIQLITRKQESFIRKGVAHLHPLLQKEISETLGISASTISRIVCSKFIQTPHGLFSLKTLCPRSYFGKSAIIIHKIVSETIKNNPGASDNQVQKILNQNQIPIARRTVNKYRHNIENHQF